MPEAICRPRVNAALFRKGYRPLVVLHFEQSAGCAVIGPEIFGEIWQDRDQAPRGGFSFVGGDRDVAAGKVEILPFESQDFSSANPGKTGDREVERDLPSGFPQ